MNKRAAIAVSIAIFVLVGGGAAAYFMRGTIRDFAYQASQPAVPEPVEYRAPVIEPEKKEAVKPAPVTKSAATSSPAEINLDVPFLLQAPKQNWVEPFENACEEASLIMVDAYYDKRKTDFGADEGVKVILDVVAYEDETYGYNKDTTAADVVNTAKNYFGRPNGVLQEATEANIKAALAKGYPVIVPAYGKALLNPNFRNGGPDYHMLVIKGYLKDGRWITNDPGTRNGPDYIYPKQRLLDAIHEYQDGQKMEDGAKTMIVIMP
jgi:hypothetical protein